METRSTLGLKLALLVVASTLLLALTLLSFPAGTSTLRHADQLPSGEARLLVASSDGLLVLDGVGAARITPALDVVPVPWPSDLQIDRVHGVAWHRGRVLVAYEAGPYYTSQHGLVVIGDGGIVSRKALDFEPRGLGVENDEVVYFELEQLPRGQLHFDLRVTRHRADGAADPAKIVPGEDLSAVGVVWQRGAPRVLVWPREGSRRWRLIDLDGNVAEIDCAATGMPWSPSLMPLSERAGGLLDDGGCRAVEQDLPAFVVREGGRIEPLSVDVRYRQTRSDDVTVTRGKLFVAVNGERLATPSLFDHLYQDTFVAYPIGGRTLVLRQGSQDEAFVLDGAGRRLDGGARWAAMTQLVKRNGVVWASLGGLLVLFTVGLPPLLLWTLRRRQVVARAAEAGARGLFVGALCLPAGSVLATSGGLVDLPTGECTVRVAGRVVALGPGLRRLGWLPQVPLIDGEPVYLVGRIEGTGEDGGPFRSGQRLRLVADGDQHGIGTGDADGLASALRRRAVAVAAVLMAVHVVALLAFVLGLL